VLIINEGKIAAQGTPEEIAGTMKGGDTWELTLKEADAAVSSAPESIKGKLSHLGEGIASVTAAALEDGTVQVSFFIPEGETSTAAGERIFDWAVANSLKILGMSRKKISLEDIFVSLTSEDRSVAQAQQRAGRGK
jgi:ABC-2 type transport system ATP-binding protein